MQPRWEAIREQLLKFKKYIFYGPAFLVSALEKHSHLCTRRLMQDVIFKKKIRNHLNVCGDAGWLWSRMKVRAGVGLCLTAERGPFVRPTGAV